MKLYTLLLAGLIAVPALQAKEYPLSFGSKIGIACNTLGVSLLGGLAGILSYSIVKNWSTIRYVPLFGINVEMAQDKGCLIAAGSGITIAAIMTAYYSYYDSPEKRQEVEDKEFLANLDAHIADAHAQWEALRNNKALSYLEANVESVILNLKHWYFEEFRDSLYEAYPLVSAHKFLQRKKIELKNLARLNERIIEVSGLYPFINLSRDQFMYWLWMVEEAIEVIESSQEYKDQYALYCASLPKPCYYPAVVQQPMIVHYQPIVYTHHTPHYHSVASAPLPKAPVKVSASISPVLNGDVYGTLWSNY